VSSKISSLSKKDFLTLYRISCGFLDHFQTDLVLVDSDYVRKNLLYACFKLVVNRTLSYHKLIEKIPLKQIIKGNINAFVEPLPYSSRHISAAFRFLHSRGFIHCFENDLFMVNVPGVLRHMMTVWVKTDPDSVTFEGFKTAAVLYEVVCEAWNRNQYPVTDLHMRASNTEESMRSAEEIRDEIYAKTAEGKARVAAKQKKRFNDTGLHTGSDVRKLLHIECEKNDLKLATWTKGRNGGQARDLVHKLSESGYDPVKTLAKIVYYWSTIAGYITDKFGTSVPVSGSLLSFDMLYTHRDRILELINDYPDYCDKPSNLLEIAPYKERKRLR
jgi:hypothetical protein